MDFTNINDPAGIKALLEQLRASQAWQDTHTSVDVTQADENLSGEQSLPDAPLDVLEPIADLESPPAVSNHISSLLSRLQTGIGVSSLPRTDDISKTHTRREVPPSHAGAHQATPSSSLKGLDSRHTNPTIHQPPSSQKKSLRTLPFIQALRVVARLAEDPKFIKNLEKMRQDQEVLEKKLWKDRSQILKNQEEKVKVAQAKAAIVGTELDLREASTLESSFLKELKTFDSDHALPAWDALLAKQQSTLEALGVPGMFVTTLKADREKQMRIVQVLDGLSAPEDEDISVEPQLSDLP